MRTIRELLDHLRTLASDKEKRNETALFVLCNPAYLKRLRGSIKMSAFANQTGRLGLFGAATMLERGKCHSMNIDKLLILLNCYAKLEAEQ